MPQRPKMAPRKLFQDENGENQNEPAALNYNDDNAANVVLEELTRSREAAKARWNFDFAKEQPLEGVWEWERVEQTPPIINDSQEENNQNTPNTQGCA